MSDTLAGLQSPYILKEGMNPLVLASESYRLTEVSASAERLLNFYAEKLPAGARAAFILVSTPGSEFVVTLGDGPILAAESLGPMMWAISGTRAFALPDGVGGAAGAPIDLGDIGVVPSDGFGVSIAVGSNAVVFCVPPRAYVTDLVGAVAAEITTGSGNFPADGCSSVAFMDGYWAFTSFDGLTVFVSELLDAKNYDSLAFAQVSAFAEYVRYCTALNGDLWLFGATAIQPWYDTGDPTFPFSPRPGTVIKLGLGSARTVVQLDGSIFFLSSNKSVYRTNGYVPDRVSTHYIEELLSDYGEGDLGGISAFGFVHEGHAFYVLQLPLSGTGVTVVYDCANQLWHERCSAANGVGAWNINTATRLTAQTLLGDAVNGNLYHTKSALPEENGVLVPRIAVLPTISTHGRHAFMNRLEVEMAVGNLWHPGSVSIDWSNDGGINWTKPRAIGTGAPGATKTRVATTRLGVFHERTLRITAYGRATIYGVNADVTVVPT